MADLISFLSQRSGIASRTSLLGTIPPRSLLRLLVDELIGRSYKLEQAPDFCKFRGKRVPRPCCDSYTRDWLMKWVRPADKTSVAIKSWDAWWPGFVSVVIIND